MMAALSFEDVRYGYEGLSMRFDLSVAAGEWLAVIGPSGAGKSTLLDLAAGFARPASGRIAVAGTDMAGVAPAERPLSFVFQDNNLFPHLSVARNVALGIAPDLTMSKDTRRKVEEALARVGLAGFGARKPSEMSGGERQRVALARAFLRDRPLLLLDEPFAALGPALRREMLAIIADLRAAGGRPAKTVVMVTHHPEDAKGHADRVAFLDNGAITALGETEDVLSGTIGGEVAHYLGTVRT